MPVSLGRGGINIFTECPSAYLLITMLSPDRITLSELHKVAGWTFASLTFQVMLSELLIRTLPSPQKNPEEFGFEFSTHIANRVKFQ